MAESSPHTKRDEALRQCSVCTSNLNGAYVKCVECKRKVTTLCIPCFQLGAEAGEHSRGHNYEVVDPVGPPICPVGSDGLVWNLSDDLTLFDFVREYKLGNWEESMKYFPDKRKALAARSHFDQFFLNGAVWNLVRSTEEPTYEGPSNYKESFCFNPAEETTKECGRIFMAHWKAKVERIMAKHPPLRVSLDVIRTLFEKYPLDLTGVASHMISCPIPIVLSEKDRPMSPTEPKKKHGKKGKNQKSVAEAKLHKARLAASKKRLTVLHRRFPESLHLMRERRPFSDHTGKVKDDDLNALGYMPARDDFEVEIRNRSELLICGNNLFERAVCDAGREFENEVKRIRMQRYRRDQKEREVAKGIVREFGLVSKFVTALKTNGDMKPKKPMDALMQRLSRCFDQELVSTLRTGDTHFHMAQGIVSKYRRFRFKGITVVSAAKWRELFLPSDRFVAVCPPNQKRVLRVIANSSGGGRVFVTADGDADDDVEEEFEEAAATSSTAVHSGTLLVRTAARPLTLRYRRLRLLKGGREAICVEFGDQKAPLRQAARVPGQSSPSASGASASRNGTYRANGAPSAPAPVRRGTPSSFGSRQGTPSRFASPNGHSVRSPASSGRLTPSMLKKPPDNEKEDKKAKRKNSREEPKPSTSAQKSLIPDNPFFSQALMGNVRPHIPKVVKKVVQSIVRKPAELLRSSKESSSKESSSSKLKEPQRKTSNAQMIDDLFNQPCSSSSIRSPSTSRKIHEKSQASSTEKPQESPRVHTPLVSSPKGERQKDSPRPSERERERRREKASDKPKVKKKEESIGRRRDSVGEEEDRGRRDEQRPLAKEEKKRVVEGPKEEEESAKFEDERPKETVVDMVHGKTKDDKQKNEEERDLEAPKIAEKIEEERPKEISYDVKADEENKGVEEIPKEQDKVNEKVEKEKEEEEEEEEEEVEEEKMEVEEEKMEVEEEKKAEEEEVPKEMAMIVTENVSESESETDSDSESESESESDSDDSESSDLPGPIQKDVKKDSQPSGKELVVCPDYMSSVAKMDDLAFTPIHGYSMLETYGTFAEDEDDDEDPPEKPTTPDFGAPKVERYHTTGEDIISWYDDVESFEKEDKEEGDGKKESTLVVVTPSGSPIRMASKTPSAKSSFVSPSSTVGDALKSPGPEYDNAEKTSKNADKEEPAMSPVKEEAPVQEAPRKKEGPSSLFKNVHEDSSEMEDSSETSDESSETSVEEEEELRNLEDMEAEEASPKEEEPLFLSPLHFSPIHSDDSSSDEADIWPSKMLAIEAPKEVEEPKTEEMAVAVDVSGLHPDEFECEDVSPATSPGSAPNDSLSLTKEFPELRENLGTEEFSESFMEDILKGSTYREAFGHATPVVEEPEAEEDRIASPLINFFEDVPRTGEHLRATVTEVEDLRQLPPSSVPRFMHELPVQWQTPRFTRPIDEIASGLRGTLEAADYPEGYRQMGYYVPPIIQQNIYVQQNVNVQQHVTIITDSHGNEKRTITNNMSTSSLVTHRTDFFQSTADMECNQFGEATDMPESGNPKRGNPKAKPPRRSRSTGSREKTRAQRTRTQEGQSSQNMTSGHRGSWRRSDENLPRGSDAQKVTGATDPVELPNTTGADDPKKSPPNTNIPGFLPQYDTGSQYPAFDHLATDPESPAPQTPSSSDPKNLQVAIYREPPSRPLAMERYRPLGEMLCGQLAIEACRSDEDDLPEPRENKEVTSIVQTFHTDQQVAILKPKPARPRRPSFKLTLNVTIPPVLMNLEPFIGNTTTPKLAVMAVVSARTLDLMNGKKKQTFCVFDLQGVKAISEAHKIIKEQEERSMLRFKKKPPKAIEGGECQKSIKHRGVAEELGISREELEVVCPPKLQAPRKPLALKGPEKIDDLNAYFDSDLGGAMDVRDLFAPTIFDFSWQGSERYLTRLCRLVFNSFMNSHSEGFLRKAATAANERGKMEKERRETERRARVSLAETVCNTVLSKIVSQKDFMESWLEDLVVKMVIYKNMQRLVRTEVKMARDRQLATMARSKSRCLWTEDVDGTVRLVCQSVLARKRVKFLAERETGDKEHGFVLDFEQFAVGPGGGGGDASKKKLFVAIAAEHFSNTLFGAIFEPLHDVDDGVEVSEKTLFEMAKKAVSVDIARSSVPREVGERILKAMAPKLEFYVDSEKIAVVTVPLGCLRRLREESRLKVTKGQLSRAKKRSERAAILDKYRNRRLEAFISTTFDGILEKIVREKASEVHNDLLGAHMFQKFCMETVSDYSASLSSMAWTEEHINAYSQFTMERLSRKTIWFRTQIGVFLELQTEWLLEDAIVSRCKAALLAKRSVEKVLEDEVTFHFNAVLSSESWAEDLLEAEIVAQCSAALTSERWAKKLVDEEIAAECKKVLCSQRCIKQLLDEAISTQFEAVVFAQFGCDLLVEELLVSQCNTALMTERWMEEFVQEEIVTCCRRIFYSEGLMQSLVEGEVVRHGGMELFVERSSEQLLQEAVVASSQVVLCAERCAQQVVVEEVSAQWEAIVFSEASFEDLLHEEIVFRCKSLFYAESWFDDFIEGAIISRCRHVRVVEDAAVKFWDRIIAWHCLQVVSSERAAVVVNGCMRTYFRRQLRRAVEVARDEDVDGFYEDLFTGELEQVAVRQQTDASAQHTTSDASQYDVLFKIFTRSFRSEYWIDVFYRCATRDVIDDICLDVLMSIIVPRLSPEVYRQKDILERRQYLPPEYRSQDRCNRYNYCAIAYQIARSIINGERLTEYMTGVYFRRALRSHARTAIIEKAVDQVFDHMVREVVAENACMIFEAIEGDKILDSVAELSTTAMIFYAEVEDSVLEDVVEETFEQSLIHYIMYDRQLLKLADEEVDKYRRQRKLTLDAHTEHLVATLEKEMLPQFCLEAMQKVVAVPNVAVEPSMDDVANVLEDASLAETKELSKEAEVSKMRLQRVMLENRAEVVMRTEHQKTFEFRANTLILKTWDSVYSNYTKNIRMSLRPGANESAYEFLLKYAIAIFLGHVKMMFNYDILREAKMPELVRLALLDFLKELYRRGDAEKVYKTVSSKFKKEEIALILKRKWDEAKNRETAALEELANHVKMLKEEAKKAGIKSAPEEEAQTVKRMEMAKRRESPVAGPSGVSAPPETERTSNGSVSSDGRSGSSKRASRSPIRGLPSWIAAGDAGDVQRWGEVGQVVDLEDFGIIKGSWDSGIDLPFLRSTRSIDGLLDKEAWAKAPQKEVDVVYVRRPQRAPLEEASSSSEEEVPVAQKKAKKGRTKNAKEKEIKEESEGASAGTQKEESTAFPGPSKRQRKSTSTAKKTTAKRRPPRAGTKRRNARKPLSSESEGERTVQRKSRRRAPPPLAIEDDEVTPSPSPEFL
ncbi:hypothetical protein QR680_016986 [Steinernema hermaphroditum]|uniref:Uncharacterized protein n=1 Tax=Steinernema hermaphroditum TaxID=289476 RepID=A0AA39HFC5_9BILA|nr:hypothetical protein QR680_016986 [Steinernema hermaphroditum]